MKSLSGLLANIPPSATLAVNDKAKALKAAGQDVIVLAGGDPDFPTPQYIVEAAFDAIAQKEATHYPAPAKGISALLELIAQKSEQENGLKVNPQTDVIVTPGGKWSLALALGSILNSGDEVLYLEPVWVSYPPMIEIMGGVPVPVSLPSDDNFRITAALLRQKITPKTKALMVNSPNNPTGRVLTTEEAAAIVEVVLAHDLYLIADELYEKLIFDGRKHISLGSYAGMSERTFTINGLSKAYAMTGWRLGWLVGPASAMKLANRMHSQLITSAATFTMYAAIAALSGPQEPVTEMVASYKARRDFMVDALNEMPGIECASIEGAFYLFPKFTHSQRNSVQLADILLEKAGIAFGSSGEKHLRFSIATAMSDLEKAVERLAKVATVL